RASPPARRRRALPCPPAGRRGRSGCARRAPPRRGPGRGTPGRWTGAWPAVPGTARAGTTPGRGCAPPPRRRGGGPGPGPGSAGVPAPAAPGCSRQDQVVGIDRGEELPDGAAVVARDERDGRAVGPAHLEVRQDRGEGPEDDVAVAGVGGDEERPGLGL